MTEYTEVIHPHRVISALRYYSTGDDRASSLKRAIDAGTTAFDDNPRLPLTEDDKAVIRSALRDYARKESVDGYTHTAKHTRRLREHF